MDEVILHITYLKPYGENQLVSTSADDPEAVQYWVRYCVGERASRAWNNQLVVKKDERGFWMIAPDDIQAFANWFFRRGKQVQAETINKAINYKALI